ncbi:MAG: spore coat U domain-containing protein [Acidobacteriota bacterium]
MYKNNIFAVLGCVALMSSAALALTATANLTSTATVAGTCTVTANPMPFGAYDPFTGAAVFHSSTIAVTCTSGMTPPPITMGQGLHQTAGSTGAVPVRQLSNGAAGLLTYNLYSDAGTTVPWEDVTGVTSPVPTGAAQNMNVYGRIDAGQTGALAGSYADTVVVTATF